MCENKLVFRYKGCGSVCGSGSGPAFRTPVCPSLSTAFYFFASEISAAVRGELRDWSRPAASLTQWISWLLFVTHNGSVTWAPSRHTAPGVEWCVLCAAPPCAVSDALPPTTKHRPGAICGPNRPDTPVSTLFARVFICSPRNHHSIVKLRFF